MPVLHSPQSVYSWRHVPSWMLLTLAAGSVNAGAFLACERYVSHVTGTATRVGLSGDVEGLGAEAVLGLGCFILGAMASVLALEGRHRRGKPAAYASPLVVVALLIVSVAIAGGRGVFGPFGGAVEGPHDLMLISILAFAMGLQNAAVTTATGMAVRTTHLTGPATDLGIHLATALYVMGEERRAALRGAALRGGKIIAFVSGAALMVPLAAATAYTAFVAPAAAVLMAAALSFAPRRHPAATDVPSGARPAR
jgi:uncharacterized membrane protein YoaK (UPF0700 family)